VTKGISSAQTRSIDVCGELRPLAPRSTPLPHTCHGVGAAALERTAHHIHRAASLHARRGGRIPCITFLPGEARPLPHTQVEYSQLPRRSPRTAAAVRNSKASTMARRGPSWTFSRRTGALSGSAAPPDAA
jgi:hypothetical protein